MKYYAVIDTNVIVSSFLVHDSAPDIIVKNALNGAITPLVSTEIMKEYKDVLSREKFRLDPAMVEKFFLEFSNRAIYLDGIDTDEVFLDKDDIIFYKVVLEARTVSEAVLITGNKKHFPIRTFVLSPAEMVKIIESNQ